MNKKDEENEIEEGSVLDAEEPAPVPETEAHQAKVQDMFLKMALAPSELIAEEEPPISPAVALPDDYVEIVPPRKPVHRVEPHKVSVKPEIKERPQLQEPKPKLVPMPIIKPQSAPLGAAGFLLSGTLPAQSTKQSQPTISPPQSKPLSATIPETKPTVEKSDITTPPKTPIEEAKDGMFSSIAKSLFNIGKKEKKD